MLAIKKEWRNGRIYRKYSYREEIEAIEDEDLKDLYLMRDKHYDAYIFLSDEEVEACKVSDGKIKYNDVTYYFVDCIEI